MDGGFTTSTIGITDNADTTLSVVLIDTAGNESDPVSITITHDNIASQILTPTLKNNSDSGVKGDQKTNKSSVTLFFGGKEEGSTVTITKSDNNSFSNAIVTTALSASENVSLYSNAITYFKIQETDIAGNISDVKMLPIVHDNIPPAGYLFSTHLNKINTPYINTKNVDDYLVQVKGLTADDINEIQYEILDSDTTTEVDSASLKLIYAPIPLTVDYTFINVLGGLAEGEVKIRARVKDNADNIGAQIILTLTKDTIAPASPTIDLTSNSDTTRDGVVNGDSDDYTQDLSVLTFTGCAEVDSTINFRIGALSIDPIDTFAVANGRDCTEVTNGKTYTLDLPQENTLSTLSGITNIIYATAMDVAGNELGITSYTPGNILSVTTNYTDCVEQAAASSIDTLIDPNNGAVCNNLISVNTENFLYKFILTKAFEIVHLDDDIQVKIGNTLLTNDKLPFYAPSDSVVLLFAPSNSERDVIGFPIAQATSISVTIDAGIENSLTPVIFLNPDSDSGTQSDSKTRDTYPYFIITNVEKDSAVATYIWTPENAQDLTVEVGELKLISETISSATDGSVSIVFGNDDSDYSVPNKNVISDILVDGSYKIRFQIEDKAGNKSDYLGDLTLEVDTTSPTVTWVRSGSGNGITPTNENAFEILTSGMADIGGIAKIVYALDSIDGTASDFTSQEFTENLTGNTHTASLDLSGIEYGVYTLKVTIYDASGNFTTLSAADNITKTQISKLRITYDFGVDTNDNTPSIKVAEAKANARVTITARQSGQADIEETFTADINPLLEDSFEFTQTLLDGDWTFIAVQVHSIGSTSATSEISDVLNLHIDTIPPALSSIEVVNDRQVAFTMDELLSDLIRTDISATGGGFTFTNDDAVSTIVQPNFVTISGNVVTLDFPTGSTLTNSFTYSYAKPQNPLITDVYGNALENIVLTEHIGFTLDFNGENGFQVDKDGIFLILYKSGGTNETLALFTEGVDLQLVKDNVDAGINPLVAREPLDFNGLNRFQVDKDGIFLILYKSGGTNETLALFTEGVDLQLVKDNVDLYLP